MKSVKEEKLKQTRTFLEEWFEDDIPVIWEV
jgi:hypothetical protein